MSTGTSRRSACISLAFNWPDSSWAYIENHLKTLGGFAEGYGPEVTGGLFIEVGGRLFCFVALGSRPIVKVCMMVVSECFYTVLSWLRS